MRERAGELLLGLFYHTYIHYGCSSHAVRSCSMPPIQLVTREFAHTNHNSCNSWARTSRSGVCLPPGDSG